MVDLHPRMSASTPAKTVAFSPLRPGHVSFKNTLDIPIKLKWPELPRESIDALMKELEKSLDGMKESMTRCNKAEKKKMKRKRKLAKETAHENELTTEPPTKKQHLDKDDNKTTDKEPIRTSKSPSSGNDTQDQSNEDSSNLLQEDLVKLAQSKKSQMIVGVNALSRCLERQGLEGVRGGVVCLSAQPALILHHLVMLAATRGVPFVALPNLSKMAAPLLGLKTALAIGFKRVSSNEADHFSGLVSKITKLALPLNIPWLSLQRELLPDAEEEQPSEMTTVEEAASKLAVHRALTTLEEEKELEMAAAELPEASDETCTSSSKELGKDKTGSKRVKSKKPGSKHHVQYFPLQIKRVVTTKKKRK